MPAAKVYTIASGQPFLVSLAQGLRERHGAGPADLAAATVLLPTRRACRALAETFLRLGDGRPTLLPTLRPLGDVDEDELAFDSLEREDEIDAVPAITPLRRLLLLAQLVRAGPEKLSMAQGGALALELARLLDALQREDLSLQDLQGITPGNFAAHWQETLTFLNILEAPWQKVLAAEGTMEPVARRSLVLKRLAERWRTTPPDAPIIAAGSTGSIPATAELLAVISTLPQGAVVLPGLDQDLDTESWDVLDPVHPQFGLKQLLQGLEADRASVETWYGEGTPPSGRHARLKLLSEAFRPAGTTDRWHELTALGAEALDGLTRIDCPGPRDEAIAIALLMRHVLERPGATAALVTPDRKLARRVAVELGRWQIAIDDSAGVPLEATPPGTFLRLIAAAFADGLAPVSLLAMLKHPLARGGDRPARFNADIRLLDRFCLRGPRPAPGFGGLRSAIGNSDAPERVMDRIGAMDAAAGAYVRLLQGGEAPLDRLLAAHVAFAEWLSRDGDDTVQLWQGEAGEALARFMHELHEAAQGLEAIDPADYPGLFHTLISARAVRPRFGRHPRLFIWGPLEARMQRADLMILGGLNEGTWPAETGPDPWLSRPMRRHVGLPVPERQIGLAAHDFVQAASISRVVLTRAEKLDGTPTVPSRWLLRLDNLLQAAGLAWPETEARDIGAWREAIDRPAEYCPTLPPAFAPPLEARPRQLSVTRIETWMRDPYAIYARYILKLRPLDSLQTDPGAAERGIAVHQALDRFVAEYPGALPPDAPERLLALGREAFAGMLDRPGVRAFWWPRFERIALWFLETEERYRRRATPLATEVEGRLRLAGPSGSFMLTAHADRIDRLADGTLAVIDYKTGALPGEAEMLRGEAPQLPLEAAIALAGGFGEIPAGPVSELSFWKVGGGHLAGEVRTFKADVGEAARAAREGLERLVVKFQDPATPYRARPRPAAAPRFGDYDHLARIKEWASGQDGADP